MYVLYTYFPKYINIHISKYFIISQMPFKPFQLFIGVNITRVQDYWSHAHSTYYNVPVYGSCLDDRTDIALY